jgi:hypothetical protein
LLQIIEDGILTDGKGRTVNFKNAILVMTSNVGSKRILEVVKKSLSTADARAKLLGKRTDRVYDSEPQPILPVDVLEKLQNNPKAAAILMEASSDPVLMGAIRTAMNGSPSDLQKAGHEDPAVANFLQRLWAVVEDGGDKSVNGASAVEVKPPLSGLDNIRASMKLGLVAGKAEVQLDDLYSKMASVVKDELENKLKPELLNRIDEIIIFSPLSADNLKMIAGLIIDRTLTRARKEQEMELVVGQTIVDQIVLEGSAKANQFGARPMRRAAQRYVEDSLSDAIIQGFLVKGSTAALELVGPNLIEIRRDDNATLLVRTEDSSGGIDGGAMQANRDVATSLQLATQTNLT